MNIRSVVFLCLCVTTLFAAQISTPDARYKADILLVVAHPDDDTLVTSYLARAIFDQHKRVAVVYCTRGDSGSNSESREHARALGLVREIEGRRAMAALGITNVWFLDGRDTASQNLLVSLANWPSASVLEQLVRIFRLTQPEVVMTWLPSSVAGENHGDHQAAGVLTTQAFDMAGDPAAFAYQIAAPIRQFENALEGMRPWQAQKLYYFTDAFDTAFMQGHGPEYSGKDISPSRKVSYLRLAAESAAAYYTQSFDPNLNRQFEAGKDVDAIVAKLEQTGDLPEPVRLWLGKSHVQSTPTADAFAGVTSSPVSFAPPLRHASEERGFHVELAGPWGFYREFWLAHDLPSLRILRPEIAVQPNDTLTIPLLVRNRSNQPATFTPSVTLPPNWKSNAEIKPATLPPETEMTIVLPVTAPAQPSDQFTEIRITGEVPGGTPFRESIFVKVSPYVAGQLKY